MLSKEQQNYVDLLEEDKPISGQKFTCVSFVSPENILKQKNMFFFEEFLKKWDFLKSMEKYNQFLNFISFKHNVNFQTLSTDLEDFVKEERNNLLKTTLEDEYKNFLDANEEHLENTFNIENNFQTSTRGIKIRGSYPTQEEAEMRCKLLREHDPNHDVYVGPVGMWMPWEPEAYKTGKVEYLEKELNDLMHEKKKNEESAKVEFDKRIQEAKEKAIEENKKIAEKSGNKLTQILNENGELVNLNALDIDNIPDESVIFKERQNSASADVRKDIMSSPLLSPKKKEPED